MLKLGKGSSRASVKRAFARGAASTITYQDILGAQDIREALAGVRMAGSPAASEPLMAWLASHPNAPEDVLRDLAAAGGREILMSLAYNKNLPPDMRKALLAHADPAVRTHAHHVLVRRRRH